MQKMKAFTNVVQCIKTKDAPVEEMQKGGQIIIRRHFMFHVLFLCVKIMSMYSQWGFVSCNRIYQPVSKNKYHKNVHERIERKELYMSTEWTKDQQTRILVHIEVQYRFC